MTSRHWTALAVRACSLLAVLAAAVGVMLLPERARTASATHQGHVQAYPLSGFIIVGHRVTIPVRMATCTGAAIYCRLGAYDVTLRYDASKLSVIEDGGFSTGGNAPTTLNRTGAGWKRNQWVGSQLTITGGPGTGQTRTVVSNTASSITVSTPWITVPTASSIYRVGGITDGGWLGSTGRSVTCLAPEYGSGWARKQCNTLGASPAGPTGIGILASVSFVANSKGTLTLSQATPDADTPMVLDIDGKAILADNMMSTRRVILCPDSTGDGLISSADLSVTAQSFGKRQGQAGYTSPKDPSEDKLISSVDLQMTAGVFGARCVQQ